MTLLEIDSLYKAAANDTKFNAVFGGHPRQLEAAAAMFNNWPVLRDTLVEQARTIASFNGEAA